MEIKFAKLLKGLLLAAVCTASVQVQAESFAYKVEVTNLTRGQTFTPILTASHRRNLKLFELGSPASDGLAALAEGGSTGELTAELEATNKTLVVQTEGGLLEPGHTRVIMLKANKRNRFMSMAAMLIPTNDAFVSVNSIRLPRNKAPLVLHAKAYDAGSEPNDELCANIPGPVCGGAGGSPGVGGEDFVHIHAGIHGHGVEPNELNAAERDWRNPVAKVVITLVN